MAALFGVGGMGPVVGMGAGGASTPSSEYQNAKVLIQIKNLLSNGDVAGAHEAFERLPEDFKGRVFGELWRVCGRPRPESVNPTLVAKQHSDFGKVAFYGMSCPDGIDRNANAHQKRMAVELCSIDLAFESILTELPRNGESRAAELVVQLPKKIQEKIRSAIIELTPRSRAAFVHATAQSLLEDSTINNQNKIKAVSDVFEQWRNFRNELNAKAEEYENLPSTASAAILPQRQKAIMHSIFHRAYELLGSYQFPREADPSSITLRAFAEDAIRKNPEIASALIMIDSTLSDAVDKSASVVPMIAAAPIVQVQVSQAHIEAIRSSIPLECAISALTAGNIPLAYREFEKLKQEDQWAVFGEMWKACGRPRPESHIEALRLASTPYFGEDIFLGIPSEDGINRSATSMQRIAALALHRPSIHLQMMQEFIAAGKVPEQLCLLRVMTPGMKKLLQDKLRDILGKPDPDVANYFRDASVTKEERERAVGAVLQDYSATREKIEPLCFEYESLVASNTNVERKMQIIRWILRESRPFLSDRMVTVLDPRHFSSELEYAKASLSANSRDFLPYLCMVEPSLAAETAPSLEVDMAALMMTVVPHAAHRAAPAGGADFMFRTVIGHNRLAAAHIDHRFNPERTTFTHSGSLYRVLSAETCKTTDFTDARVVSMGASGVSDSREAILFDSSLEKSPLLKKAYQDFVRDRLDGKALNPKQASKAIAGYIHEVMFNGTTEGQFQAFYDQWRSTHLNPDDYISEVGASADASKCPIIPIDEFIRNKRGVCRHQALVACYFISKLMKDRPDLFPPSGRVHHVRDNLLWRGAHVWAWYLHPDGHTIYHIDPMWDYSEVFDRNSKEGRLVVYEPAVIQRQLDRLK